MLIIFNIFSFRKGIKFFIPWFFCYRDSLLILQDVKINYNDGGNDKNDNY